MALPLSELTFYRMPDVKFTYSASTLPNISQILNGLYTSLSSTTDYAGVTIPSSHKWTWATASVGVTNAVYNTAVPTGTSMTQNPCYIFAGSGSAATPTMITPDTYQLNTLHAGIVKNPGAYSNWTSATPMTSGQFSGYTLATFSASTFIITALRPFVSQEAIFLQVFRAQQDCSWLYIGPFIEPHTSYSDSKYNNIISAETDDRIYAITTTGHSNAVATAFQSNSAQGFLYDSPTTQQCHFYMFKPGTATIFSSLRTRLLAGSQYNINEEKDIAGNFVIKDSRIIRSTFYSVGDTRGIYDVGLIRSMQTLIKSRGDLFHIIVTSATVSPPGAVALKNAY